MNYKIIFFDVDGTLTSHEDGRISNKTKEAIKILLDKGYKVVAATGRPLSLCKEIRSLGIETLITANGAYAKHQHQVIHKVVLDSKIVQEVSAFALKENNALSFFTEEFTMNGVKDDQILKTLKETLAITHYPSVNPLIYQEEVYLMCLYATDVTVQKYAKQYPHLSFQRWHPFVSNVLQENVSKSIAIQQVLKFFGLKPHEAIAFGDGENDIDMLEYVGLGIAMGNGSEQLKAVADFVTKKSSEDGIDYALKKFGII